MTTRTTPQPDVDLLDFIDRCHAAVTEQSRGRPDPLLALWARTDDVSIMAAIGGYHVGFAAVSTLLREASTTQSFETWTAENLLTTMVGDLAFSVEIEHYGYRADDRAGMSVRATQIYRRADDGGWQVVHRHGDVLVPIEAKW
jgi:ketosteroid isomerase-like protein